MSPSSREISGPRPASLKIHKDSHLIHKQSSSSSSSSSSSTTTTTSSSSTHHHHQRHHPVIIYTHSPKIIHTQARDFMALVQKLTGLSHSTDDNDDAAAAAAANNPPPPPSNITRKNADTVHAATDDSSSSSENYSIAGDVVHHVGCSSLPCAAAMSPLGFDPSPPSNPFLSEIPLFTPNSSDFFCPPRSFYRYPESAVFSPSIPNMGGAISPSMMEAMKAFPEY
ncbi:VQ motif-containing protein 8, chloroplastic-like [Phoenix dactylifera]|uniref:VQ motif-containing protein 8, chloroplastic-like n=1 Tax=Phoenix dactylifera TaxID=42345 RepID=A0A8B7MVW6_PHODC|nr:VQ motif-containing protein 8, chloroplastic-like [Phoenix dactylifera]